MKKFYCQISQFPLCCGLKIIYSFSQSGARINLEPPYYYLDNIIKKYNREANSTALIGVLNLNQITQGYQEELEKYGFKAILDFNNPIYNHYIRLMMREANIGTPSFINKELANIIQLPKLPYLHDNAPPQVKYGHSNNYFRVQSSESVAPPIAEGIAAAEDPIPATKPAKFKKVIPAVG